MTEIPVAVTQPVHTSLPPDSHILAALIGIDILPNAPLGGRAYQAISSRISESIARSGWSAHVRWPAWFAHHRRHAVYLTEV